MEDIKVYGTVRSGTVDKTVALAEEILNTETGNKVNVDLRKIKDSTGTALYWH